MKRKTEPGVNGDISQCKCQPLLPMDSTDSDDSVKRRRFFHHITPYNVDIFCIVTYIPFFVIFNLIYWFYIVGLENF